MQSFDNMSNNLKKFLLDVRRKNSISYPTNLLNKQDIYLKQPEDSINRFSLYSYQVTNSAHESCFEALIRPANYKLPSEPVKAINHLDDQSMYSSLDSVNDILNES